MISPHFSQESSRKVVKCRGYEAHRQKHSQTYCPYVENAFAGVTK